MKEADDGDGSLSYDEFVAMIKKAQKENQSNWQNMQKFKKDVGQRIFAVLVSPFIMSSQNTRPEMLQNKYASIYVRPRKYLFKIVPWGYPDM